MTFSLPQNIFFFLKLRLGYSEVKTEAFLFWEEAEGSELSVLLQT